MKKSALAVALVALCLLLAAPIAVAQEQQEQQGEGRSGQWLERRGEMLRQRIELLVTRFENNEERHMEAYNRAKEKVKQLLETLQDKGYDVSRLAQDLAAWDAMIVEFAKDYAAFIAELKELEGLAVGQSEGQFRSGLQEARQLLMKVHQDALDIRLFYQKTIRADIQEIKAQVPSQA